MEETKAVGSFSSQSHHYNIFKTINPVFVYIVTRTKFTLHILHTIVRLANHYDLTTTEARKELWSFIATANPAISTEENSFKLYILPHLIACNRRPIEFDKHHWEQELSKDTKQPLMSTSTVAFVMGTFFNSQ